jgi:hypothetical protein
MEGPDSFGRLLPPVAKVLRPWLSWIQHWDDIDTLDSWKDNYIGRCIEALV